MHLSYIFYFEIAVGLFTAFKARQKNRNVLLWWILGTAFSLIALFVVLEMPQRIIED